MAIPVIQFIVLAIICALFLGFLSKFPNLDATIVQIIRILILIVLSVLCLNVVLLLLFGHTVSFYLTGS